jgi:phosphoribosyl-dephospho-CoA transferase
MVEPPLRIERHQMVQVDPAAWTSALSALQQGPEETVVAEWAMRGWPLIGRRAACEDVEGLVPLGLPLPPSLGRRRLMLRLPPEAIRERRRPPLLEACSVIAPVAWRATIDELLAVDADVRCFGSLAWQWLTHLPYLTPTSDLDLLWTVKNAGEANAMVERIAPIADRAPMRLDGELLLPSGQAVHWREWASDAPDVLAKSVDGIAMVRRDTLFA